MSSKREEERNEKIIRGLMKLPPNRRCINCNSLGPQYVCTNFWTFICITCSGIHREFTHRVKSVSMAKFTFQEVDALQKGGNQRARELFLKAWDQQRDRLPTNSNIDKVREFIKNVYVDKKYTLDKAADRPPRDPQSLRSPEDETRRASSYHSYSQSPPYDFQYEERRYGKHAPALTRKPGSDRGLYEGKFGSFLSPTHLSDHGNDRFSNEGSYHRASDYSVSGGGDIFGSDILSPSSQRDAGSPFSETSPNNSREVLQFPVVHESDENGRSNGGKELHPQRTTSSGSFGSFDSSPLSLPETGSKPEEPSQISHAESSSVPSLPNSSVSGTFGGLDLFSAPYAPQNVTSIPSTGSNSQLLQSSMTQSVNVVQHSPISSVPTFTEQQPSRLQQSSPPDFFAELSQHPPAASFNEKAFNVVMPDDGGWATFDMPQNAAPTITENVVGNFNPFSIDQNISNLGSVGHESSAFTHTFVLESVQSVKTTINDAHSWNAFDDDAAGQPIQNVLKSGETAALHSASDAEKSLGFGVFEAFSSDGNVRTSDGSEPPLSSLSSQFSTTLNDFSIVPPVDGVHPFASDHEPINPFDLPFDSDMESTDMSHIWNTSSLQAALPNTQASSSYVSGVNEAWFPQTSVPSFVAGGVSFDPTTDSLGFIAGQAPCTPMPNIHAQGPVAASVGGNPFA